ncbi:NitT/TauT family transport system ATP-binding protein [Andreprevotia lacus DSM 23236]|jgi:NitT/TauT family transport system ATP-binding protein|uniref:NitT/TauT family transport system ATP-binding protein n=1 Tax=Andreprevotia lacus DSM 23236 TaxID=1121001 RepID=A0A1W1XGI0_9NEIS|nr:ABC transporter ATP-binding protein [Andreprevotia lacus]SMC22638.1 NitT/TauT family transport system ATP-binding protein [Andreprevotia lacus DSM 23236]
MNAPLHALQAQTGRVALSSVSIRVGSGADAFTAVQEVDLDIAPGEFVCLLGPSGCGKSTLLGALAGHLQPAQGRILLDGAAINGPSPERGLVFQHHTLLPWRSVIDNVAFGLKMRGQPRAARHAAARALLELVGLGGFETRYPAQLSGGMQQRVEIARVLLGQPRVLLMDEPFGALDALTRLKMQQLLLDVWDRFGTTVVFVTHDIDEALFLADRIVVMSPRPGRIIEDIRLPFARPRDASLSTSADFNTLKRHLLALLHHDADAAPLPRLSPLGAVRPHELQFAI